MKKNKAKQMLLSLGLMATVASPLVTVISCGESDETAPEITVDQKTTLDGETIQGSGTEYTLSLTQGTTVTQAEIEGLFTVDDDMDEDVTLTYTWETGTFEAATTGECVLTISSEDAAGNSVAYTLTITVSPPEVEGAGSGGTDGSDPTTQIVKDTTAPVISNTGTVSGGEQVTGDATTGYALDLTTDTATTVTEVEALFTATDDTDKDVKVNVAWDTTPTNFTIVGTYVATFTATDVAGNKAKVTLTVTVEDAVAAEPELEVDATDAPPTIVVDTETAADSGDASSVVSDNEDGTGTLTLTTGSGATEDSVQSLFSASDTEDGDFAKGDLKFTWDTALDTSQAGAYKLTVEVTDSASQTVTYVLTVTVEDAVAAEPELEVDATDAPPTIVVDTETAADSGDASSVVSDNEDGTGTLTLTTGSGATKHDVQSLFSASDTEDGDFAKGDLKFTWDTALDTSQAGAYKLTVEVTDSASQTVTYVLTVTVEDAVAAEPELEVDATDAPPTIVVDTETAADSGDASSVVSDNEDGTGTLTLTTGSGATEDSVQSLFSASDTEDGDFAKGDLKFTWDTALDTSQAGAYKLTVEVTDSASQTVTYVLTVTVEDAVAAEPELEVDATDAPPTIVVDTETAADSGDASSVVSDNEDGTGTLTLTTGSGATEDSVQSLFSASDTEDGDFAKGDLKFTWDTALDTSQAGAYKLTVEVTDSASQTVTYVLTVTVTEGDTTV